AEDGIRDPLVTGVQTCLFRSIAHGAGRQVALTLSDSFCVDRYRDEFLDLMRKGTVDLVFANEAELHSLYQTSDFEGALNQFRAEDRKSTRLNSSHEWISYAVF